MIVGFRHKGLKLIFEEDDPRRLPPELVEMDMAMKNPAHPGTLIRDDIEELRVTVAEAAVALGVTRQQLYRVIRGESGISPEMAVRLEKALGGSAEAWLRMQINYDLAQIRRVGIDVERLSRKVA